MWRWGNGAGRVTYQCWVLIGHFLFLYIRLIEISRVLYFSSPTFSSLFLLNSPFVVVVAVVCHGSSLLKSLPYPAPHFHQSSKDISSHPIQNRIAVVEDTTHHKVSREQEMLLYLYTTFIVDYGTMQENKKSIWFNSSNNNKRTTHGSSTWGNRHVTLLWWTTTCPPPGSTKIQSGKNLWTMETTVMTTTNPLRKTERKTL